LNETEVAEWAGALSENERLILSTYQGETCMPEGMERYWNARALENLIAQGIMRWTMAGYELCEAGVLLARFLGRAENPLENGQETRILQIADKLRQPGKRLRSNNLKVVKSGSEASDSDGAAVIPFPQYTVPHIDWDEIETIRKEWYPDLPAEIIDVLKPMMASTPDDTATYEFQFSSGSDDPYPPDPVPLIPGKACAIWMMDLMDRYGGIVTYSGLSCAVEREEIKHPVYMIQPISREQFSGINDCLQEYEFMTQNTYWRVFSKYLSEYQLVILFAKDRINKDRIFKAMLDINTFAVLQERLLESKEPWDEILLIKTDRGTR